MATEYCWYRPPAGVALHTPATRMPKGGFMTAMALRRAARVWLAVLLPALLLGTPLGAAAHSEDGGGKLQRVAYFIQWGVYGRQYFVKNVDASGAAGRLTTLNYAFGNVTDKLQCASFDSWADWQRPASTAESVDGVADAPGQALAGNFNQLRKLKALHPKLRVQISLGGFSGSAHFSDAALTDASRQALVASSLA